MARRLILLLASLPSLAAAGTPATDTIDYSTPENYLVIPPKLGNREAVQQQANAVTGRDDLDTSGKILSWMDSHLTYNPNVSYQWRDFDDVVQEKCYGGCADQGIICGALLRAAGIPTVWVKTMDVSWIWDFKQGRPFESWSGHVFIEVYLDRQWVLLDPGAKLIYREYSPAMRILPGNRFAYEKGSDPKQMVMSLQWEEWKEQTRNYFTALDTALLPVDPKSAESVVPQVYIVGNDPYYRVLEAMARSKGWSVLQSFNTDYDKLLPLAKGHTLLVESHLNVPIVPIAKLEEFFPNASGGLKSADGVIDVGGTTIMFVDFAKILNAIGDGANVQGK